MLLLYQNCITIIALPLYQKTFFVSVIPRTVLLLNLCFFRSSNESMFLWVIPKLYYFKNRVLSCRDTKIELPRSYYLWINRGCSVLCGFITIAVVVIPKRYYFKKTQFSLLLLYQNLYYHYPITLNKSMFLWVIPKRYYF